MRIDYSKRFIKQLKKAPLKIRSAFKKRLAPLISLKGKWQGFKSIDVTADYNYQTIKFYAFGTHSQLYG